MAWSIVWTDQALRDVSSLDAPVARRIVRKLERAAVEPRRFFERLAGAGDYKLRIGDHRLITALDHESRAVLVEHIDHRSRVYDRRR